MRFLALLAASAALVAGCDPALDHDLPSPLPSNDDVLCPLQFTPAKLAATAELDRVHLTFTPAGPPFRTVIERSHHGEGFLQIGDVDPGAGSYDDTAADPDDELQYIAVSKSSSCESPPTPAVTVDTLGRAVTGLALDEVTDESLHAVFTDTNQNETGYVARATPPGAASASAEVDLDADAGDAQLTGLVPDTAYDVMVAALSPSGEGASATVSSFTLASAPTGVTATVNGLDVDVAFASDAAHATGFTVSFVDAASSAVLSTGSVVADARAGSFPAPADGTTLRVDVAAVNPGGTSSPGSATVDVPCLTGVAPTDLVVTSEPADATTAVLHVAFTSAAPPSYRFDVSAQPSSGLALTGSATAGVRTVDVTAPRDTAFDVALTNVGPTGCSDGAAVHASGASVPFDVTNLTAIPEADGVHLTWSDANTTESAVLVRRTGIADGAVAETNLAAGATSFVDAGAVFDDVYDYDVVALGPSGQAAPVTANVATLPAPPLDASVTTESGALHLRWTNASTTATSIRIDRALFGQAAFTTLATLPVTAVDFVDTPPDFAGYAYRVVAVSAAGSSFAEASGSLSCDASLALTNLQASVAASDAIRLTFAPSSSGLATRIQRAPAGSNAFVDVLVTAAGATQADDTTAARDQALAYRARGETGVCSTAFTAPVVIHSAPNAVAVTASRDAADGTRMDLSWSDANTLETGYRVERQTPAGSGTFTAVTTLAPDSTSFVDATAEPGAQSSWRVVAVGVNAERAGAAATLRPAPLPPVNASSSGAVSAVQVNWSAPAGGVVDRFEVVEDGAVRNTVSAGTSSTTIGVNDDVDHVFAVRSLVVDAGNNVESVDASAGSAHRHRAPLVSFTPASATADASCQTTLPGTVALDGSATIVSDGATTTAGSFAVSSASASGVLGRVATPVSEPFVTVDWSVDDSFGLSASTQGSWLVETTATSFVSAFTAFQSGQNAGDDLAPGRQPLVDGPMGNACAACVGPRASIVMSSQTGASFTALTGLDGQVWVAGQTSGVASSSLLTPVTTGNIAGAVSLASGANEVCGVEPDGSTTCVGSNPGLPINGVALSLGGDFGCAIDSNSEVFCQGSNPAELGSGLSSGGPVCQANAGCLPLVGATLLASTGTSSCAATSNGLFCWGQGAPFNILQRAAQQEATGPFRALAAGNLDEFCTVDGSGFVQCLGSFSFAPSFAGNAVAVAVDKCVCALGDTGVVECQPLSGSSTCEGTHPAVDERICLDAGCTATIDDAVAVATAGDASCAVTVSHGVLCWGDNTSGQLGSGDTLAHPLPQPMCASGSGPGCPPFSLAARRTCGDVVVDPLF